MSTLPLNQGVTQDQYAALPDMVAGRSPLGQPDDDNGPANANPADVRKKTKHVQR